MTNAEPTVEETTPNASRPIMPGYGVPESAEGMLPWSHAVERLAAAKNYWIATADATGQPHAIPVWGAWVEGALYFGAGPRSARNLAANPHPALSQALDDNFAQKYDWRPSAEGSETVGEGMYVLRPAVAFAWTSFPGDATRWHF